MLRLVLISFLIAFSVQSSVAQSVVARDSVKRYRVTKVVLAQFFSLGIGLSYLSYNWYKDKEMVPFHYYNDNKGHLQMDKAGHAFTAYHESFMVYKAYKWAQLSENKSLFYGALSGFMFQLPIEIFDGLYEGWGFSWGDVAANTSGALLFGFQQAIFHRQVISMKFSYAPSSYRKTHEVFGSNELEYFFNDYNGHTYWLSGKLHCFFPTKKNFPKWLNIALGYSANGMIFSHRNPKYYQGKLFPHFPRYRQFILSVDLNFKQIKTKRKGLKLLFKALNVVKFPFPALSFDPVYGLRGHAIYF